MKIFCVRHCERYIVPGPERMKARTLSFFVVTPKLLVYKLIANIIIRPNIFLNLGTAALLSILITTETSYTSCNEKTRS